MELNYSISKIRIIKGYVLDNTPHEVVLQYTA